MLRLTSVQEEKIKYGLTLTAVRRTSSFLLPSPCRPLSTLVPPFLPTSFLRQSKVKPTSFFDCTSKGENGRSSSLFLYLRSAPVLYRAHGDLALR